MAEDLLTLESDPQEGEALITPVMRAGRRLAPSPSLTESRRRAAAELDRLPESLRRLEEATPYPVRISASLQALAKEVDRRSR